MSFAEALEIRPLDKPLQATIRTPGSKSIANRALVLAALTAKGDAYALHGVPRCEDTEVMIDCLRGLGFRILTEWPESLVCVSSNEDDAVIPAARADLFVANSGTTMRFLTAVASLGHGRYRLDGAPRMRRRPIEDLAVALRQLGATVFSEHHDGCPPVIVEGNGLRAGKVRIESGLSSQFVSALMMAATRADGRVKIRVMGEQVSAPYVRMTVHMLGQFQTSVTACAGDYYEIFGQPEDGGPRQKAAPFAEAYRPPHHRPLRAYHIEPDATAASYFWGAAAICGGAATVLGLHQTSLQGDVRFLDLLEDMGCEVAFDTAGATLRGGPLRGADVDMNDVSDTVMTLAAVACFARGPTTIRNVAHIRHKESDRISALATEMRKIGAGVEEYSDGLKITPAPLHGAFIETYNDHRIAMSMALIGLRIPGIVIKNPACVAKTYPAFFDDLEKLRD